MAPDFLIGELTEEHAGTFCACLMPKEPMMIEAGDLKAEWLARRSQKDYGVKLALSPHGDPVGMIQYVPAEGSQVDGPGLWFVFCVWIPPARRGGVPWRKKGVGAALLAAAEEDVRGRGAAGLAAWGTSIPVFMRSSWFKKHGYRRADRQGIQELVWKPFTDAAQAPRWRRDGRPSESAPPAKGGPVVVRAWVNGICPAMNAVHLRFRRAAAEAGGRVVLETREHAAADAIFIDGKEFRLGPPPSYRKIVRTLHKAAAGRGLKA